jgi:MYXO-CTERM domain-containing protein
MRRLWLLALSATVVGLTAACDPTPNEVPTEAEAPTPNVGQITFPTIARSATDGIINLAECSGAGTIRLKARIRFIATPNLFTEYRLYVANDDDEAITDPASTEDCQTTGSTTGLLVGLVEDPPGRGSRTENISSDFITDAEYATSRIVSALGLADPCGTSGDIHLCFQARRANQDVGTARVTLSVVVDDAPAPPVLKSVTPGEEALNVDWDATTPGAEESYAVEVGRQVDPADPLSVVTITSPRVSGTELRFENLTIGTPYNVQVRAFSDADNPSDPSNAISASPVDVRDFFESYQDAGGQEQGGCGTGGGGVLALVGLAALVALRRRS